MAADLAAYRAMYDLRPEELAKSLSCAETSISTLALCARPDSSDVDYGKKVERIASYVGADVSGLLRLLREVEAVGALRSAEGIEEYGLLAARDSYEDKSPDEGGEGDSPNEPEREDTEDGDQR